MLTYNAHINGGHYAIESIPANSTVLIDVLASSYNGLPVKPVKVFIGNAGNSGNCSVRIAGVIFSSIPPYANDTVDVAGIMTAEFVNAGDIAINVMFADEKMKTVAAGVFASLAISSGNSEYSIVNNFELFSLSELINEGRESDIVYNAIGGLKLSGLAKFGSRGIAYTNISSNDASGLTISKSDYFDMSDDFTLGFWFYSDVRNNACIVRFGVEGSLANSLTVYRNATTDQFLVNAFGVVSTVGNLFDTSGWNFFSLSKIGTNVSIGIDGTERKSVSVTSVLTLDTLGVGYAGLGSASYVCMSNSIDALFFIKGVGLWGNVVFTPPTEAPV